MSTLALCITLVVLSVMSFLTGFAFCMLGVTGKVRTLNSLYHHDGQKWNAFKTWIEK